MDLSLEIPETLNQAMEISKNNNPDLIAKLEFEQSKKDIVIADQIYHSSNNIIRVLLKQMT